MPSVISGAPREVLERSLGSTQGALSDETSRGTKRGFYDRLEKLPSRYLKVVEGGGGEPPPPPQGSKSYTIVKTLNLQKNFDFESMKNFLKGDVLGKFSSQQHEVGNLVGT